MEKNDEKYFDGPNELKVPLIDYVDRPLNGLGKHSNGQSKITNFLVGPNSATSTASLVPGAKNEYQQQ